MLLKAHLAQYNNVISCLLGIKSLIYQSNNLMPFIVAHILLPVLVLQILGKRISVLNKILGQRELFLVGLFGFVPDLDVAATWIFNFVFSAGSDFHRTLTHTLIVTFLIFVSA